MDTAEVVVRSPLMPAVYKLAATLGDTLTARPRVDKVVNLV